MRIEVKGRNLQVTEELRESVERRMDKIGKQVSELAVLEVEIEDTRTPTDPVTAEAASLRFQLLTHRRDRTSVAQVSRRVPPPRLSGASTRCPS